MEALKSTLREIARLREGGSGSALEGWVTTDFDGNPRIAGCVVDLGAFESEGAAAATLISAVSQRNCEIDLLPELKSEPRQPSLYDSLLLTFDVPLTGASYAVSAGGPGGNGVTIEEASCAAPNYQDYLGPLEGGERGSGLLLGDPGPSR